MVEINKNILIIYKSSYLDSYGGVETFIKNLLFYFRDKKDLNFRFLSVSKNINNLKVLKKGNIEIFLYPITFSLSSNDVSISFLLNFRKHANWANIIHYNYPWPFADMCHYLMCIKKKYIISYHSDIVKQKFLYLFYSPLKYFFLKNSEFVIFASRNYLNNSKQVSFIEKKLIKIIPYGLDPKDYKIQTNNKYFFKNLPKKYLLFVGVLRYYKSLEEFLIFLKNTNEEIKLVIAGDGPRYNAITKIINDYKLKKRVVLLKNVSNQQKSLVLKNCTALILPSLIRSEAFGISLLEGMLFKKPLIAYEFKSGSSDLVKDGINGFLLKKENKTENANKINNLYKDYNLQKKMGNRSKELFDEKFNSTTMSKKYLKIYEAVLR